MNIMRRLFCQAQLAGTNVAPELFTTNTASFNQQTITSGRAWKAAELRLKSDDDLHKLWYVLFRETNVILSDRQMMRQFRTPRTPNDGMKKVKQSMARLLAVVREREMIRERYLQDLKDKWYDEMSPPPAEPLPKAPKAELTADQQLSSAKRRNAVKRVAGWSKMTTKQRRKAIAAEYGKMANEARVEFLSELKLVGMKLKEAGIVVEPKPETPEY